MIRSLVAPRKVFLSSRIVGLSEIRLQIFEWAKKEGHYVWVAEKCSPVDETTPYQQVETLCLKEVRDSDLVLCILHEGYGDTWKYDPADISLLELEIFQAVLAKKPIEICVLEPFQPEPRLAALLRLIKIVMPSSIPTFSSRPELVEHLKRRIERASFPPFRGWTHRLRGFITALGLSRHPIGMESQFDKEIRFLDNQYVPHSLRSSDKKTLLSSLLARSRETDHYGDRLILAWKVLRHLFTVPFRDKGNEEFWPLWVEALGVWSSAAAWSGLHGHLFMGRLAADNSLIDVRSVIAAADGSAQTKIRLLSMHGAIASEYYSISKGTSSRKLRQSLLCSAIDHLDVAEKGLRQSDEPHDLSGFLAIRGSVLWKQGKLREAIETYRHVVEIRREIGKEGALGEAKAELGYALLYVGRLKEAGTYLEEGVAVLEKTKSAGFAIRAKEKLATYYLAIGALAMAYRQLLEVEALTKYHGTGRKTQKILRMLASVRRVLPMDELDVQVSNRHYPQ